MIKNKEQDSQFSYDALTDLSHEHGDYAVIENMLKWLQNKMGGKWKIIKTEE